MKTKRTSISRLAQNLHKAAKVSPVAAVSRDRTAPMPATRTASKAKKPAAEWLEGLWIRLQETVNDPNADENAQRMADHLLQWMEKAICPVGFLKEDPAATASIFVQLDRLRCALCFLGWRDEHENQFSRLFGTLLRFRLGNQSLNSQDIDQAALNARINQLVREPGLRHWSKVLDPTDKFLWQFRKPPKKDEEKKPSSFPVPGSQSDEAAFALLRRDWSVSSESLTIDHQEKSFELSFRAMGQLVLSGHWDTQVHAAGKQLPLLGEWEPTCWHADSDGEYLELRRLLGHGLVIERQIFLARAVEFLWLSDTIKSPLDEELEIVWRIPAPAATGFVGSLQSRAKTLKMSKGEVRIIPATLPAELLASADGKIDMVDGSICYATKQKGVRLMQAAAFTWSNGKLSDQLPWKKLTVTADRTQLSEKEAVAVRIPIKNEQVVAFRRFYPILRCAFVGYHTLDETVIGAFDEKRYLREWVTVK